MLNRITLIAATIALAAAVLVGGAACEPKYKPLPYMPKAATPGSVLVCHDAVGHVAGNKPWVLGGNCCCTPTEANFALHTAQGTVDKATTYEQYRALYQEKGVATDLDHKACGNVCPKGPHVVLGGKCMATPTPGTWMYERVTFGPHVLPGNETK